MNNIEILEEFINEYKKEGTLRKNVTLIVAENFIEAIENLVQENKELKEELEICEADLDEMTISNEHKKKEWVNKLVLNSYIPKSKVKEKIEVLKMKADYDWIYKYDYEDVIKILQELLEEGE